MKLTEDQQNAVRHDENTLIVACPGSGKTRALVAKLLRCLEEVRGSSRRITCITYTNSAVYEIENRLRIFGKTGDDKYCDISTIHAFCLNYILQFFYWRLPEYKNGFTVLPSDSEKFREIVSSVCEDYELTYKAHECFELLNRDTDGTPIITGEINANIALDFWNRLSKDNYIDFPNIIYYSFRLIVEWPSIAHALACRFAWFLVDEFQDTSALQVEIFKHIAEIGKTKFFLVGDPFQSIYGFAGARPDLMHEFAEDIDAKRDFKLVGNFRSSIPIIKHAERLCPRNPPMIAVGNSVSFKEEPGYLHCSSTFEGIIKYFLPALDELGIEYGKCAILAPWWVKLLWLGRELRDYGIPIVGPGARPYKRTHLFALLAEQVCAYVEHPDPKFIYQIEKELYNLINNITGSTNYKVYSYMGRIVVYRLINCGKNLRNECENGLIWLKRASENFANILIEAEFLPKKSSELLKESVKDMEQDMIRQGVDVDNLSVEKLGMFASTEKNMKLLTMHRAKGREFDAVAIVDLHEGKVPHYSANTAEQIDDYRRLLYVSITRAKRLLMYITDKEDHRNIPSRFLCKNELDLI